MFRKYPAECILCTANQILPNFTSNAHMPVFPTKNTFSLRMNKINHIPSSGKVYSKNYTSKLEANDIICKTQLKYFDMTLMPNEFKLLLYVIL